METSRALNVHQRCHVNIVASRSDLRERRGFPLSHSAGWNRSSLKDLRSRAVVLNLNGTASRRTAGCTRLRIRRSGARKLHFPSFVAPSLFLIGAFCCLFISLHLLQHETSNTEEPFWTLVTHHHHIVNDLVNDLEGLFLTLKNPGILKLGVLSHQQALERLTDPVGCVSDSRTKISKLNEDEMMRSKVVPGTLNVDAGLAAPSWRSGVCLFLACRERVDI